MVDYMINGTSVNVGVGYSVKPPNKPSLIHRLVAILIHVTIILYAVSLATLDLPDDDFNSSKLG